MPFMAVSPPRRHGDMAEQKAGEKGGGAATPTATPMATPTPAVAVPEVSEEMATDGISANLDSVTKSAMEVLARIRRTNYAELEPTSIRPVHSPSFSYLDEPELPRARDESQSSTYFASRVAAITAQASDALRANPAEDGHRHQEELLLVRPTMQEAAAARLTAAPVAVTDALMSSLLSSSSLVAAVTPPPLPPNSKVAGSALRSISELAHSVLGAPDRPLTTTETAAAAAAATVINDHDDGDDFDNDNNGVDGGNDEA